MTISSSHSGLDLSEGPHGRGRIIQIGPDRVMEAIGRLLAVAGRVDRAHANRFLEFAAANRIPLERLWSFENSQGELLASVLAVPSPGRTAMMFVTQPDSPGRVVVVANVLNHACMEFNESEVNLAQALLEPSETLLVRAFVRAEFRRLADLTYLERPLGRMHPSPAPKWPANAEIEQYRPELDREICTVLERSYQDTLDCPGLVGLRQTADVFAGHRATGLFEPGLWTVLRIDGRAEGVLLLNPSPVQKTVELVYLGLSPAVRGCGLGRELLRHGLQLLKGRSERCLTLAVDDQNEPALRVYQREGFRRALRRVAMIRSIRI